MGIGVSDFILNFSSFQILAHLLSYPHFDDPQLVHIRQPS